MTPEERMKFLTRGMDPSTEPKLKPPKKTWVRRPEGNTAVLQAVHKANPRLSLKWRPDTLIPRCKRCKNPAVKGLDVCYHHGGAVVARNRKLEKGILPDAGKKARANIGELLKAGGIPLELAQLPVVRNVTGEIRDIMAMWKRGEGKTKEASSRKIALQMILYKLVFAWTQMEIDPNNRQPWTDALNLAQEHGVKLT